MAKITAKAAMVNAGYTQTSLADKLKVSRATINAWMRGRVALKPHQIFAFCYVCGISEDELILPTLSTNVDEGGEHEHND